MAKSNAELLTVFDFARAISVSSSTVVRMLQDGQLRSCTVRGRRLIPRTELRRIVSAADDYPRNKKKAVPA